MASEEVYAEPVVVRWVPLLSMSQNWEAIWRIAISDLNTPSTPLREYKDDTDDTADIHFLAYEATWHRKVSKDQLIETSLADHAPAPTSRIVLVACDRTPFFKISEKQIQTLANENLLDRGKQVHVMRAYTTDNLRTQVENLIFQTMMEHGMTLPSEMRQAFENFLSEEDGGWNARAI